VEVIGGGENGVPAGDSTRRRAGRLASGGAIREAAASLFLDKGYLDTSMDDIAAAARISKQTIYTHFRNKEELFADLVLGNAATVDEFIGSIQATVGDELEAGLRRLARRYTRLVSRREVLRLRRLVIAESSRFSALAAEYYERVPGRALAALGRFFAELAGTGRLSVDDPGRAAQHFAWLCVGAPLDRGMFYPGESPAPVAELDRVADSAVEVFLAAYGPKPGAAGSE
jgi:TetR/AcrR family transcriptional repressor of mexJK operon